MSYRKSHLDKKNFKWFESDNTRASLVAIGLERGAIRGLSKFSVSLTYPITVFSGANGSGKSTILALSACAFHNKRNGFVPALRNKSYYTFHDFFVQSNSETPVEGVSIAYGIRHNNWRRSGPGIGFQRRKKKKGGKWNDYDLRVDRNVIYFGVQRVVPHYERSTHKSYRSKFKPGNMESEDRKKIANIAARIIGKPYTDFDSYEHTKYSLPVASSNGISYSGFNMGAGESAVFEILTSLLKSGPGTLLVIDEIELGLHELAQVRLIDELKKLCNELKCQVICSSHSHGILRSLPPEARFHVESIEGNTFITAGVSADFACGKMGRPDAYELDVFVEDQVAVEILQSVFPAVIRRRVRVKPIGSHAAVVRQLASRRLEKIENCVCILDGDQSEKTSDSIKTAQNACEASNEGEKDEVAAWVLPRIFYLPGSEWPERWVIDQALSLAHDASCADIDLLVQTWGLSDRHALIHGLNEASSAEKHNEFRELAIAMELTEEKARADIISLVAHSRAAEFEEMIEGIRNRLP